MKPVKVSGTRSHLRKIDGQWEAVVKNIEIEIPVHKGPFPKRITDLCKKCPLIYCEGWSVEVSTYFTIWLCKKRVVQERNK